MKRHSKVKWTIRDTKKIVANDRFVIECYTNVPGIKGQVATVGYLPNARLIVTAPELLEVCKIGEIFGRALRKKPGLWTDSDENDLRKIQQAIAKAEGEAACG